LPCYNQNNLEVRTMNNELKELLRAVLKEELVPIGKKLEEVQEDIKVLKADVKINTSDMDTMKADMHTMKADMNTMKADMNTMKVDMNTMKVDMNTMKMDIKEIKEDQDRLQKYIIISLGEFTDKITQYVDDKTEALNKRVFTVETKIQRLTRQ
jgi:chromosome segregation ATPase